MLLWASKEPKIEQGRLFGPEYRRPFDMDLWSFKELEEIVRGAGGWEYGIGQLKELKGLRAGDYRDLKWRSV